MAVSIQTNGKHGNGISGTTTTIPTDLLTTHILLYLHFYHYCFGSEESDSGRILLLIDSLLVPFVLLQMNSNMGKKFFRYYSQNSRCTLKRVYLTKKIINKFCTKK